MGIFYSCILFKRQDLFQQKKVAYFQHHLQRVLLWWQLISTSTFMVSICFYMVHLIQIMVIHVTNARIRLELKFIAVRMYKDDMAVNMLRIFYKKIKFLHPSIRASSVTSVSLSLSNKKSDFSTPVAGHHLSKSLLLSRVICTSFYLCILSC